MKNKKIRPILVSIIITITGIILLLFLHLHWSAKSITVNNPAINRTKNTVESPDLKSIIHETEKCVVQIEGQNEYSSITGSGFLYNNKGDIITNAHVVNDADVIYVKTANARVYPAAVIGVGKDTDIAVIRVPQLSNKNGLEVAANKRVELGDEVIALGSPHGFQNTVTLGIISGKERNLSVNNFQYEDVYQISAQITHGNSGGPLIDRATGKVIGINSVGTEDGTIGFSIPVTGIMEQIKKWSNDAENKKLNIASTKDLINTSNPKKLKEDANYLANYFFESISIRDYIGAYTLLGSKLQSASSYSMFREKYIHIVKLEHSKLSTEITAKKQIKVTTTVTTENKVQNKEKLKKEASTFELTIGQENDQLKILKITKRVKKE